MNFATLENTVFVSTCDYPDPDGMSNNLRRTADRFGVPLAWASYGDKFRSFVETKIEKVRRFLENKRTDGIRYAFVMDCRDVVFVDHAEIILAEFNLTYTDGVLFNADLAATLWPYGGDEFSARVVSIHGADGVANSGVYCGAVDDILAMLDRILDLKRQFTEGPLTDSVAKIMASDPAWISRPGDTFEYDQFFVQALQIDANSGIRADRSKRLLAVFKDVYPVLSPRESPPRDDPRSVGTAKMLHSPWMSANARAWNDWTEREVLR